MPDKNFNVVIRPVGTIEQCSRITFKNTFLHGAFDVTHIMKVNNSFFFRYTTNNLKLGYSFWNRCIIWSKDVVDVERNEEFVWFNIFCCHGFLIYYVYIIQLSCLRILLWMFVYFRFLLCGWLMKLTPPNVVIYLIYIYFPSILC